MQSVIVDKKICPKCGKSKTLNYFGRNKTTKDGLQIYCKKCASKISIESIKKRKILINVDIEELKFKQHTEAEDIVDVVSQYYDITKERLRTPTNLQKIVRPRMICYYFFYYKNIGLNYTEMANTLNQKTHGNVIHGINTIEDLIKTNRAVKYDVNQIDILLNKYIYSLD